MPYAGIQTEETSFAILKLYYKSGGNLKLKNMMSLFLVLVKQVKH